MRDTGFTVGKVMSLHSGLKVLTKCAKLLGQMLQCSHHMLIVFQWYDETVNKTPAVGMPCNWLLVKLLHLNSAETVLLPIHSDVLPTIAGEVIILRCLCLSI